MASASHVTVRKRATVLFLFIAIVMVGLVGRLAYLQFFQSHWLTENATDQRVREIPVEAKRGIIYDRNGKELAVSVNTESVYAIPAEIVKADETAAKLAAILALDTDKLSLKLKRRQAFTWIKRKISETEAAAIKELDLPGIGLTQEGRRQYPYDNLASHILGFTGIDSQGLDGVELTFDSYLKGRPGGIVIEYDAKGREIPYATHRYVPPIDGQNVFLTIDLVIQQIVERELEKVLRDTKAKSVSIIVIDPNTGEILALANKPDYNPNRFADYAPVLWRDSAISNAYEPGSTFKIITTSAVLGDGVVTPEERLFDPGEVEVQGRNIHCWKPGGHGSQTFVEVVKNSCNVGFVNVGLRLGAEAFYRYIKGFGFGQATGIDLPGEAKGIIIDPKKVTPINIATMSIGQSIAVTPIQLICAAGAVANNGKLLRPQIVREVKGKDGSVIRSFQPDVVETVLNEKTAQEVKGILENVVEQGTGKGAYIEGFRIAGKTGTAQKVGSGGYAAGKYVASFVGFAPVEHPRFAILVVIDEPIGAYYGGVIAAPVFNAVAQDIFQYLKLVPEVAPGPEQTAPTHMIVPSVYNYLASEAAQLLQSQQLLVRVEENGERVADQVPKPGSRVPVGSTVILYTVTPRYAEGEITVPDLTGKSKREAADILGELGLLFQPFGNGDAAIRQNPFPGSKVQSGTTMVVFYE
ncbi:MAG: spoVD 1 [Firmicutes bacterium]|nr:spoVD 1 [Bacillota bacterium]